MQQPEPKVYEKRCDVQVYDIYMANFEIDSHDAFRKHQQIVGLEIPMEPAPHARFASDACHRFLQDRQSRCEATVLHKSADRRSSGDRVDEPSTVKRAVRSGVSAMKSA